jgi:hypothetical protein
LFLRVSSEPLTSEFVRQLLNAVQQIATFKVNLHRKSAVDTSTALGSPSSAVLHIVSVNEGAWLICRTGAYRTFDTGAVPAAFMDLASGKTWEAASDHVLIGVSAGLVRPATATPPLRRALDD